MLNTENVNKQIKEEVIIKYEWLTKIGDDSQRLSIISRKPPRDNTTRWLGESMNRYGVMRLDTYCAFATIYVSM